MQRRSRIGLTCALYDTPPAGTSAGTSKRARSAAPKRWFSESCVSVAQPARQVTMRARVVVRKSILGVRVRPS